MMRRELNVRPATTSGWSCVVTCMASSISSTSYKRDNFNPVAIGQFGFGVKRARHDFQIALDSDLAPVQLESGHEVCDAGPGTDRAVFAIDCQLKHGLAGPSVSLTRSHTS